MPGRLPLPQRAGALTKAHLPLLAYLVGAMLVAAGVGVVFWPAGLITLGVFCLVVSL